MTLRVKLDAGEHRVVSDGGLPVGFVANLGPAVVLIEGREVRPGSGWSPDGWTACSVVVSTPADQHADLEVR